MWRKIIFLVLCLGRLEAQTTPNFPYLPQNVYTTGGGFASPSGKFAYASVSHFVGQNTYLTAAQEYTLIGNGVQSCTLAGATHVTNQWGPVSLGTTGLVGGCQNGSTAWSAQEFAHYRIKKTNWGVVGSGMINSQSHGLKVTVGLQWGK